MNTHKHFKATRPTRKAWTRRAPFDRPLTDFPQARVCDVSSAYYVEYWSPLRSETYVRWFGSRVAWLRFAAQERRGGRLCSHGVMRPRQTPAKGPGDTGWRPF
jgi:hypothetical protein